LKQKCIFLLLLCGLASFFACGNNYSGSGTGTTAVLPHRALISNLTSSRIDVADTTRDLLVTAISGDLPGRLLLSNDKKYTVSLSPQDFSVNLIANATQTAIGSANLTGQSSGVVLTVDNNLILGPVPTEPGRLGEAPGALDVIFVGISSNGTTTSASLTRQPSIFLPGVKSLAATPNTSAMLAMSDSIQNPANPGGPSGRVWAIQTSLVNTNQQPYQEAVSAVWDHPVFAVGSTDNLSAYVLNCGPECGGSQASVVQVTFPTATNAPPIVGTPLPIPGGATMAFLSGNNLYIVGNVPAIGPSTPAVGTLSVVDLASFTVTGTTTVANGYHDRMTMGADNLLFVGSRRCDVTAGCLAVVDTLNNSLMTTIEPRTPFTPPAADPGDDVTGMTPIANRNEVYVIQGGELIIYDTTTKAPKVLNTLPNIIGQGVDVVAVDF
jgi:hypothetical protein